MSSENLGITTGFRRRQRSSSPQSKQTYELKGQLETESFWYQEADENEPSQSSAAMRTSLVEQRLGRNLIKDHHSLWWAALNEYSMRSLTKSYDKLPAIKGLAIYIHDSYLQGRTDDQYVMGMWLNQITAGLLWYVDLGSDRNRPETYRAPSWSWASVDGVIFNDSLTMEENESAIELLGFNLCENEGGTSPSLLPWLHDQCTMGTSIMLRGRLSRAFWSEAISQSAKRYYVARSLVRHESEELEGSSALQDLFSPVSLVPKVGPLCHELLHPETKHRIGWFLPDTCENLDTELYCLKIQVKPLDTEDPQAVWAIRGLVLVRATNQRGRLTHTPNDCYRRVGYFELDCEYTGTSVGSQFSHTEEVNMRGRRTHVDRYIEFPILNEPILDPSGMFANQEPRIVTII